MFASMGILTAVLLSAGVLLCLIEVFVPKFGITGVLGIFMVVLGASSYYIDGVQWKYFIGLVTIIMLVLSIAICIELVLEARHKISNPNRHQFRTYKDVPLTSLIGSFAKAVTNIDMGGTIEINGKMYYAIANAKVDAGKLVEVIGVNGTALIVRAYT